jgi:hypothetical protein
MASSTRLLFATVDYHQLYAHHVKEASLWEVRVNAEMARAEVRLLKTNPDASKEWISAEVSANHYVQSYIGKQQFHTREATKYGLGMLNETLCGLVAEMRAFGQ